jgi:hypothetical protein
LLAASAANLQQKLTCRLNEPAASDQSPVDMAACSHSRRRRARLFDLFYQVEIRSRHLL